jgi:hypothetical protein
MEKSAETGLPEFQAVWAYAPYLDFQRSQSPRLNVCH